MPENSFNFRTKGDPRASIAIRPNLEAGGNIKGPGFFRFPIREKQRRNQKKECGEEFSTVAFGPGPALQPCREVAVLRSEDSLRILKCLCAVLLSDTVKASGVQPETALTIPKRCNFANRPIGYKCGRK
ncbi:hypothetical protein HID58_071165 [Brassica napus]|uniref:Bifunctional inhibitor/plant lipid transfer protein/seed storage helical domain-containing protein n=1 Tax=Brassica napus TaxID=3708 RepID=A0ABQ7Z0W5_BRANA|nr:hypothetical protein HID58_071165 [Brassica napus]